MAGTSLDTEALKVLVAAADTGSLSRAAALLGMSLSRVSRALAQVEARAGTSLMRRTGRGVRPTPAGRRAVQGARRALEAVDELLGTSRQAVQAATWRVGADAELAVRLLPGALADVVRGLPAVRVELGQDALPAADDGPSVLVRLGPSREARLHARTVGLVEAVLCGPARLPSLQALGEVRWAEVEGGPRQLKVEEASRRMKLEVEGPVRARTASEAAELAARLSLHVVLPAFTALPYLETHRLVLPRPGLTVAQVPVQLVTPPAWRKAAFVQALEAALRAGLDDVRERVALHRQAPGRRG